MHLQPDAVPGRVEEAVLQDLALLLVQLGLVAVLVEEVADEAMDVAALHARLDRGDGEVERLLREPVELAELVGGRADREGAREVGEAGRLAVPWEEVEEDDVVGGDRARAAVVTGRRLRAVRDHELLGRGAVLAERALDLELDPLARERLAVEDERAVAAVGAAQHVDADLLPGLDGAAGPPDPLELEARSSRDGARRRRAGLPRARSRSTAGTSACPSGKVVGVAARSTTERRQPFSHSSRSNAYESSPRLTSSSEPDVLEREHLQIGAELAARGPPRAS